MALEIATCEKLPITLGARNMATFGVHLVIKDESVEVVNKNITMTRPKTVNLDDIQNELTAKVQQVIDDYKARMQIYNHPKYDALVSYIANNITV